MALFSCLWVLDWMSLLTATDASTGRGIGSGQLPLDHFRLLCDPCFFVTGDVDGGYLLSACLPS